MADGVAAVAGLAADGGVLRVHLHRGPLCNVQPVPPPLQFGPVARVADGVYVRVNARNHFAKKCRRH